MEPETAELGGYRHVMEKEIFEQPDALRAAMRGRGVAAPGRGAGGACCPDCASLSTRRRLSDRCHFVACGTAYHAGLIGKALVESLAGLPAAAEVASEFRYREPLVTPADLVVAISQSGETSDTLGALREAQRRGARSLGVVNVVGSSVAREVDDVLYTRAGPEIAVASTKAYTTQIIVLTLLALELARLRGRLDPAATERAAGQVAGLPALGGPRAGLGGSG